MCRDSNGGWMEALVGRVGISASVAIVQEYRWSGFTTDE